jgi:hypothetical protein
MRNFGRGMWRRVGDFEKTPGFKEAEYLAIIEYRLMKQRQEQINEYRKHILQTVNSMPLQNEITKTHATEVEFEIPHNTELTQEEESVNLMSSIIEEEIIEQLSPIIEEQMVEEEMVEEIIVKPLSPIVEEQIVEEIIVEKQIVEEIIVEEQIVEEQIVEKQIVEEVIVEEPKIDIKVINEPIKNPKKSKRKNK